MSKQENDIGSSKSESKLGESRKLAEKGLATSDQFVSTMARGFDWIEKKSHVVVGLFVVALVLGAGFGIYTSIANNKEKSLGDKLASIEEKINRKKEDFSKRESEFRQSQANLKDPKNKAKSAETALPPKQDFEKDYSEVINELKEFISKEPSSKAAKRGAIEASLVLNEFNRTKESLEILQMVKADKSDFLSGLVRNNLGLMFMAENNCDEAIKNWDLVLKNKEVSFLHSQAHYQQGLCYLEKKDFVNAENLLMKAKAVQDSSVAAAADRALRIVNIEKQKL